MTQFDPFQIDTVKLGQDPDLQSNVDHTNILNIGTNTHAQIDTHIADATVHFTEATIDHVNILNVGTNTHAQIDTHIAGTALKHTAADITNVPTGSPGIGAVTVQAALDELNTEKISAESPAFTGDPTAPTQTVGDNSTKLATTAYADAAVSAAAISTGDVIIRPISTIPSGFLETDGSLIEITLYETLYDVIGNNYGLNTGVTFTADAGTDVLSAATHGKIDDDIIEFTTTTTLPAGLTTNTKYFIRDATTNTYKVSLTKAGTAVDITDSGTGTHSFHDEINIPDYRGEFLRGWNNAAGSDPDAVTRTDRGDGTTGDVVGSKQAHEFDSHQHRFNESSNLLYASGGGNANTRASNWAETGAIYTSETLGGNETRPRNVNVMYCIKF